jgi:hypothetical protein
VKAQDEQKLAKGYGTAVGLISNDFFKAFAKTRLEPIIGLPAKRLR